MRTACRRVSCAADHVILTPTVVFAASVGAGATGECDRAEIIRGGCAAIVSAADA